MSLSAAELNRATLHRQLLLGREPLTVPAAVRRIAAIQAQEPASPYLALWNRVDPFAPADLDAAFADRTVVKASLMRLTLHAVLAEDHPSFHAAMAGSLRASRLNDARFTGSGLTVADLDALLPEVLAHAEHTPRTAVQIGAFLAERLGAPPHKGIWWAMKTYAPMTHMPTGGPWSFGVKAAFRAAPDTGPDPEVAVRRLVRRYLEAFGPASVPDVARFTLLTRTVARAALQAQTLRTFTGPDGTELYDVPDGVIPAGDTPAPPRLMAMWDSVLLAYADRGRLVPPELSALVTRNNGDVLPTLLVDGRVAGVWRPVDGGIEATAYGPVAGAAWDGLAAEARALVAFLAGRDPAVYRRYDHWWAKLPPGDTRLLATRPPR